MTGPWRYASLSQRQHARAVLMALQRGRCAGCFANGLTLHVDHDHSTGLVRGMLCPSCNRAEAGGSTVAWSMYVERPPASFTDPDELVEWFALRCSEEERRAFESLAQCWRNGLWRLADRAVRDRLDAYAGWHSRAPHDEQFAEWRRQEDDVYRRAVAAADAAVTVDVAALGDFTVSKADVQSVKSRLVDVLCRQYGPIDRNQLETEELERLSKRTSPHQYVPPVGRCDYATPCTFPGCDLREHEHPLTDADGRAVVNDIDCLRALRASLLDELERAA